MASQSQGIQELLQAEKVSEALKRKKWRLKQAKEEAQAEIETGLRGLHIPACSAGRGAARHGESERTVTICISLGPLANGGRDRAGRPERAARRRQVGEHRQAQTPGDDQPVRANRRPTRRSSGCRLPTGSWRQPSAPFSRSPTSPAATTTRCCALPPTPLPRSPTSLKPSPSAPVSRPLKASVVVAAAAAPWPTPPSPHWQLPPCHRQLGNTQLADCSLAPGTAPPAAAAPVDTPPIPFPGFRLASPGPPIGHLRTKGPPCQGGREIREARAPVAGWGGDVSVGPFFPPLSAPTHPRALEGRDWTLAEQSGASMHSCRHARKFTAQATPDRMDLTQKWLGCLVGSALETKLPSPPPGVFQRIT
ncbi:hypothetical protein NN561_000612 [Cricetulus griseus]